MLPVSAIDDRSTAPREAFVVRHNSGLRKR